MGWRPFGCVTRAGMAYSPIWATPWGGLRHVEQTHAGPKSNTRSQTLDRYEAENQIRNGGKHLTDRAYLAAGLTLANT